MPRPISGGKRKKIVHVTQKNGDIYVIEREKEYDAKTKRDKTVSSKLIGKIKKGTTEVVQTRKYNKKGDVITHDKEIKVERKRIMFSDILEWIGKESNIDADISTSIQESDAIKIITIARFLFANSGRALGSIYLWQINHNVPYKKMLTKDKVHNFFEELGGEKAYDIIFFKNRLKRLDCNNLVAFDSTTISTYSKFLPEARFGYNKDHDGKKTIKILTAYSVKDHMPILYRIQPGNLPDVTSIKNTLTEMKSLGLKKLLLITDNGYYSQKNINQYIEENINFITLVSISIKYISEKVDSNLLLLESVKTHWNKCVVIHGISVEIEKNDKKLYIYLFLDEQRKLNNKIALIEQIEEIIEDIKNNNELNKKSERQRKKYLLETNENDNINIDIKEDVINETIKKYGIFCLISNVKKNCFEILEEYRLREKVEEYFNSYKNDYDAKKLNINNQYVLRGKTFVQFIALSYYCFFFSKIKNLKEELEKSIKDENTKKTDIIKYKNLLKWLNSMSIEDIIKYFECTEQIKVENEAYEYRFSTESTARDTLFLKKIGFLEEEKKTN